MSIVTKFCILMDTLADSGQNKRKEFDIDESTLNIEKDISYFSDSSCKLDIYEKKNLEGKKPVLLLIHGGSFVAGDKYYRRLLSKWNAGLDYFVVNINYGLGPKSKFIDPIKHVVYALNWIENNSEKYNLDMDKVVVSGDSAGAYMACLLTILSLNKDLQKKFNVEIKAKIKAAVLICGIYDYYLALKKPLIGIAMSSLLKDFVGIKKKDMSSFEYKEVFNLLDLIQKDFPSTFISYSKKDILCGGQSQELLKKLDELKLQYIAVHSTKLTDNHCYSINWTSKAARECNDKLADFMNKIKEGI